LIATTDVEFCNPFDAESPYFWMKIEHCGRYLFAKEFAQNNNLLKILDAACANGYGCFLMAEENNMVYGLDISKELLAAAQQQARNYRITNVQFIINNLEKDLLPFGREEIELVTCFETLEHLINPEFLLNNLYQVLIPEGYLLLSVPNEKYEPKTEDGKPRNPNHKQLFDKDQICKLLTSAGFEIKKVLTQPYTNIFFNREKYLIDNGLYDKDWVYSLYPSDEKAIVFFARLFAMPQIGKVEDTYSIIVIASKPARK